MKILRLIFLIAHLGILLLLLGTLLNAYIPPKIYPWFNLLSLGFPVLIIAYILLTIFWIFSWKKRAVVFVALGLLFLSPIKRWVNFTSVDKAGSDLKIVSLNAKGGILGQDAIEKYIDNQNADIVMLQEHGDVKKYQFNGFGEGKGDVIVSIFSKYKIIDQKELIDSDHKINNAYANQTDIEIKGNVYRFINVYLQPFKFEKSMVKLQGDSDEDKQKVKGVVRRLIPTFKMHQEQIEKVRKGIDESPYPVILVGDFNSVPNSYEYYHLGKGLKDAFVESGRGSATSFHDYKFPIRIDYVFTSQSIQPLSYQVDRSVRISDHYPVITTFKLKK
ncbi:MULTISPECIES: endonuclease/exonuclease/phosphatase family protein [Chryseobacterium]|uniref:endonuclease/exonuclease/phosphatase family protein n=1 Tax=Chryseobacterium TaxID=59732 RepID=UPI001BEC20B9|nr:endonuclease/exonuclease/phosphatase family protein [Chryseobacterium paludis]MBT2621401.1 endonuclease/exonuclease/phosphatase family protein [Chryseobacterium sp. ISL-6]